MTHSSDLLLMLEVPCDEHAPAVVRRALAELDQADLPLDDGVLVASELVTNAVLHSGWGTERMLDVRAHQQHDGLLISVHDHGGFVERAASRGAPASDSAVWGVRIIERLSRRWGCGRPDGYRIWAEVPMQA